AIILDGQKKAKKRIFLFFCIYFITGIITSGFGIDNIVIAGLSDHNVSYSTVAASQGRVYTFLLLEAIFVPVQGFLNALAYGWTREDFLTAMSSQRSLTSSTADWRATAEEENDETDQLQSQHSVLSSSIDEGELEETVAENV
ncbi:hypothetical protein GBAR_LOCUS4629, partial [Geodia barretti]